MDQQRAQVLAAPLGDAAEDRPPAVRFGAWLKTASQQLHKNKLAVALANKLARIAWSVLHNEKGFDTQPEAVAI